MAYAYLHRESPKPANSSQTVTYPSNAGTSLSLPTKNVDIAKMLIDDICTLLTEVGIANTKDYENLSVTLTGDNVSFYVGVNDGSSVTIFYPRLYQDGDPNTAMTFGLRGSNCRINDTTANLVRYNMYIYTTTKGGIYMEITDVDLNRHYPLFNYIKIPHPTNPNDYVILVGCFFNTTQSNSYGMNTKDPKDLTHNVNCVPVGSTSQTVVPAMANRSTEISTAFPDLSGSTNVVMKKLVFYDLLEIPEYFQVPTTIDQWTDFDDGTYKYHVQAWDDTTAQTIRIAIRYDTV